CQHSYDPPYSF
nr:immunoglobulin light chain junction region [Macaca mulatta]MOW72834.1 immunoglobulin light chain junction region [Macaca mulatta]MOW72947.1 immunoglobulin light chain junction region [Macaca mulatta]MOW72974.1 immunoglobulin light chain junction region [Macaca mulatta]MOW73022.1 immunoglobulin light chain junction region [Macaca mulatta]